MPTYFCRAGTGLLNKDAKGKLAVAITRIHAEVENMDPAFVQVLFWDLQRDDCYIAGRPLSAAHFFLQGQIRAGRSAIVRAELIDKLVPVIADILGLPRYAVWIYLDELPPRAMAEYGHILPEPGDEDRWLAKMPDEDRKRFQTVK